MITAASSPPWFARPWLGALLGLTTGLIDTVALVLLGVHFEWRGADVTLWVGAFFSASFVALGWLAADARRARFALAEQSRAIFGAQEENARLERLAALGALSGTVAHEVRNPLAIIRSSVQNVGEGLEPDSPEAASCRFAIEEIDRLSQVTRALVAFTRPLQLKRRPTSPGALVERARVLCGWVLDRRGLALETPAVADERPVSVDADLVLQLVLGLVQNAAAIAPQGSQVTLRFERADPVFRLHVEDEGPGVPEEVEAQIFEPLFTTRADGAGLGLAVARQIAEAHGGEVRLAPADRGAHFVVELPLAEAPA